MAKKRKSETISKNQPESTTSSEPLETIQEPVVEEHPEVPIEAEVPSEDGVKKPRTLENHEIPADFYDSDPDPAVDPSTAPVDEAGAGEDEAGADEHEADADDDESDPAAIQKLLDPFPKGQLVELLRDAALKHPDVLEEIHRIADADPTQRKIFVHGLGWDTNADTLTSAFCQYGEIEDCKAVIDKISGKSKGYGFILFKHRSGARRALLEPQKKIGNRIASCQLASAGPDRPLLHPAVPAPAPAPPASEYTQRKIFVSNVGSDIDPQKLLQFFSQFGEIEEGPMGLDKVTGKPRGFTLFVYKTIESAKKALEEPHKKFEGLTLHCQKAVDGPKMNKSGFNLKPGGAQISRNGGSAFMGGMRNHVPQAVPGHLMAPSGAGMGFNQAAPQAPMAAAAGLNPALAHAVTALLATQGAGLGLTNLFGPGMGGTMANQTVHGQMANTTGHGMQGTYGNQAAGVGGSFNPGVMGGYGAPAPMQDAYGSAQGSAGRTQQGAGYMGGGAPYMGR